MNEEDMIKNIEQLIAFLPTVHVGTTTLEIMLEEYKRIKQELHQEKEKNKKLEELSKNAFDVTVKSLKENLLLNQVIDLMAEDISISNLTNWEFGCNYEMKECECMNEPVRKCEDCIKEYHFRKVRGEKNG